MNNKDDLIFDETGLVVNGVKDKSIETIILPDFVVKIGSDAFGGCKSNTQFCYHYR